MAPADDNTARFAYQPITGGGFPSVADDHFHAVMNQAVTGGPATQQYFDSTNQTADFWTQIGNGTITYANGVDPNGNPIVMASSGNVDMRLGAFYQGDAGASLAAGTAPPPTVGITTVQTLNTTTRVTRDLSLGLQLLTKPGEGALTKALFADLLTPLYTNFKTFLTKMAANYAEAAQVEEPSIDPLEENEDALSDASTQAEEVGGELAAEGTEFMTVAWGTVALEAAGMGALVAIPLVVESLGHQMINSVNIVNETDLAFTWSIAAQIHGAPSVLPSPSSDNVIPARVTVTNAWAGGPAVVCAYDANFQFINSSDIGSIDYVLNLAPSDGGTNAKVVVAIPFHGQNTIWVGVDDEDGQAVYANHSAPNGLLSMTASFGNYQISLAVNALSGTTSDAFFYGVVAYITVIS